MPLHQGYTANHNEHADDLEETECFAKEIPGQHRSADRGKIEKNIGLEGGQGLHCMIVKLFYITQGLACESSWQ